jgi:hypothetical protein
LISGVSLILSYKFLWYSLYFAPFVLILSSAGFVPFCFLKTIDKNVDHIVAIPSIAMSLLIRFQVCCSQAINYWQSALLTALTIGLSVLI